MPDNTTPQTDPKVAALAGDIQPTADLVKAVIDAIKAKDLARATSELPRAVAVVQKDIADVEAAVPVIKSGWKTSEFWVGVLGTVTLATIPVITHQPVSTAVASAIGALGAVYIAVRGIVKAASAGK